MGRGGKYNVSHGDKYKVSHECNIEFVIQFCIGRSHQKQ